MTRRKGNPHEDQNTFLIISRSVLLTVRCFGQMLYRKSKHILCWRKFLPRKSCVFEIMWKIIVLWCMRIACWIPKTTNTHSEYVILIAFPLQQSLHEPAWILRYTYTVCLVNITFSPMYDMQSILLYFLELSHQNIL